MWQTDRAILHRDVSSPLACKVARLYDLQQVVRFPEFGSALVWKSSALGQL
jgi:hypothetical protein